MEIKELNKNDKELLTNVVRKNKILSLILFCIILIISIILANLQKHNGIYTFIFLNVLNLLIVFFIFLGNNKLKKDLSEGLKICGEATVVEKDFYKGRNEPARFYLRTNEKSIKKVSVSKEVYDRVLPDERLYFETGKNSRYLLCLKRNNEDVFTK